MKKVILSISLAFMTGAALSQAAFNITAPANIGGNYGFTWADPGGGEWSTPDFNIAGTFVEDTLMFVEDGSPGTNAQGNPISREGCNPLINDLTGKIAVIYRNTCEFGLKAFNAQNAGAVAVIIINREAGVIGMLGGTNGIDVTIPVVFVDNVTGGLIANELNSNNVVTAFMGNKVGFYDYDLAISPANLFIPSPNAQVIHLADIGAEHPIRLGGFVDNPGAMDQTGVSFNATISFNGSNIYNETLPLDINSTESQGVEFPEFSPAVYNVGKYTLTYSAIGSNPDEYESDNTYSIDFYITDDLYSYASLDTDMNPDATVGYQPNGQTNGSEYKQCIHFQNTNASRVKFEGIHFTIAKSDELTNGEQIDMSVMRWNQDFTDLNDSLSSGTNPSLTNTETIATKSYYYDADSMSYVSVYGAFDTPIVLEDQTRYLFCIATYSDVVYLGYNSLDYTLVYNNYLQPLFPLFSSGSSFIGGFGADITPAIGAKLTSINGASVEEYANDIISIYPNPSAGKVTFTGDDMVKFNKVDLLDMQGRTIASFDLNSNTIDVSKFEVGNYLLLFTGKNNAASVQKLQIAK